MDESAIAPWDCRDCKRSLPLSEYWNDKGCTYGKRKTCRGCVGAKNAAYRDLMGADHWRDVKRLTNYGMTRIEYDALFRAQGSRCGMCPRTQPSGSRDWHVDHDHSCCPKRGRSCGKCIRGILCHSCNLLLGHAKDDPAILLAGVRYLERTSDTVEPRAT